MAEQSYCVFCEIVAGREPARFVYQDEDIVAFHNVLTWVPVMLLIIPRKHMTQTELWDSGPLLGRIGELATRLGRQHCPGGFRVLSNFGPDAMQSQPHGHVHVIGGTPLGLYVKRA